MKGDRDRCLAAGMDAYLAKPIQAADLTAIVESLASDRGGPLLARAAARDFSAALGRVENDVDILCEQMEMFLSDSPATMNRIREAAAAGDCGQLQLAAHRLRGFASNFDAEEVVAAAARLEQMGLDHNLHDSLATCGQLEGALAELRLQLQQYLQARL